MAREFQRGHKAKISDLTAGTDLYVGVQISGPGLTFDISCFGLDADERLSDDRYFIFFNQPKSPEDSIQLLGAQSGDTESFRVTLDQIPSQIQKLSFTATIDGAGQMSQIAPGYLRIVAGGEEVARYSFDGSEFSTERAVMLGDLYLKDVWRFAAVGQGFDGGLDALLKNFGGEVAEEEPEAAPQQPAVPAQPQAPAFAPPPQAAAQAPSFGAPPAPLRRHPRPPQRRSPGPPRPRPSRRRARRRSLLRVRPSRHPAHLRRASSRPRRTRGPVHASGRRRRPVRASRCPRGLPRPGTALRRRHPARPGAARGQRPGGPDEVRGSPRR